MAVVFYALPFWLSADSPPQKVCHFWYCIFVVQGMIRYASVMLRRVGVGWGYSRLCGLRDGCDATCGGVGGVGGVGLMTFLCFASWVWCKANMRWGSGVGGANNVPVLCMMVLMLRSALWFSFSVKTYIDIPGCRNRFVATLAFTWDAICSPEAFQWRRDASIASSISQELPECLWQSWERMLLTRASMWCVTVHHINTHCQLFRMRSRHAQNEDL